MPFPRTWIEELIIEWLQIDPVTPKIHSTKRIKISRTAKSESCNSIIVNLLIWEYNYEQ
jgi:hypothetical protein